MKEYSLRIIKFFFIIVAIGVLVILFLSVGLLTNPVGKTASSANNSDKTTGNTPDKETATQASIELQTNSPLEVKAPATYFEPEDIHDLVKIEMCIDGKIYTNQEPETLQWVEKNFSQATREKGTSACPFCDPMYLTRADGQTGIIYPATDSCDIFQTKSGCYDYGTKDNSEFWSLFGDWYERLY